MPAGRQGWPIQRATASADPMRAAAQGYEQGFFVGGLLLIAGGLIALVTMNPQRSVRRLADTAPHRLLETSS